MPTFVEAAVADTFLRSAEGTWNAGAGASLWVANSLFGETRVTLLRFDTSSIPSGATVTAAHLSLYPNTTNWTPETNNEVSIYRILPGNSGWVEGTGVGEAQTGSACWDYKAYHATTPTNWAGSAGLSTSGTDYVATALGSVSWTTPAPSGDTEQQIPLTNAEVEAYLAAPTGLLLRCTGASEKAIVYHSLENESGTPSNFFPTLSITYTEAPTGQVLRPDADVADAGWTNETGASSPLSTKLADESDATYIQSPLAPSGQEFILSIDPGVDPEVHTGHSFPYRYGKNDAGGEQINLTVSLYEGTTLIAQQTHTDIPATITEGTLTLTEAEAAEITNYGNLRMRGSATQV